MCKKQSTIFTTVKIIIIVLTCLLFSVKANGITGAIFNVPLSFVVNGESIDYIGHGNNFGYITSNDVIGYYVVEKNLLETGSILTYPRLGAPFTGEFYDFPMYLVFNFEILVLRFILFIYPDPVVALNIYYVILPALIGISAFFALRSLDTPDWINMGGAVAYAFLPFYFMRALEHFALTAYQFVPLAFLICVWGYQQKIFSSFSKKEFVGNYRNWLTILFCLLIANNGNGYWQAFSCFFILLTGVMAFLDTKKWKNFLSCLIPIGLIVAFFLFAISPFIHYQMIHGRNPEVGKRLVTEADVYGLKLSQMLLPYEFPGDTDLETRAKTYLKKAPLTNENATSYIGVAGALGFLLLLFTLLRREKDSSVLLDLFARLNICAVLLAIIGGFATIGTVFLGSGIMLRSYNRISVYIAFLGISAVCLYIQKLLEKTDDRKRQMCRIGAFLLFVSHFVFLYSWFHNQPDYAKLNERYQSDKQFVAAIESSLPEKAMVYQMPYRKFPEAGRINQMADYQHFTGFLHSQKLRWSYGGMKGRSGDAWQRKVAALPLRKKLEVLSIVGFEGIYIDRRAYKPKESGKLEKELKDVLKTLPLESRNKNLVFFSMNNYNHAFLKKFKKSQLTKMRKRIIQQESEYFRK